ncbi:2-succinyl-5-enolpyruvyl-6-hydroxy-3-cyclohexene-1-carboxylic-acid synthase [uncultured Rubrobacteraceae bacterium]|uniref:2-succinyl-5-enolpyruvyl-6-hydroxy-3-cyclohexene-1-carboxylate synthase n=1 Tax=uncultured Rubrobacteraceae bacterium TaxID=349277 RepID=A0A6J4QAG5_9ACTN|nr:2-succinyl-5-enolpyruvyl-6-hydroxy-3-cyclohexene-1-carboxylic-acid synthase [uncultured Rubrobacteraceae bacterium]
MNRDTPRANRLWAYLIVEELLRCGVGFFCVAPGSRSTPLVAALAASEKARSLIHFDERGTAFAALGYARATGRPAAWITTSGTAVANGLPAVVEAATDGVPMVLLTADRPPELRQTGANQTIDQPDIFGDYVRWRFDLPAPDPSVDPAMVLTTVDQAAYRAVRTPRGPVHLNLMFREPFLSGPEDEDILSGPASWVQGGEPYTRYAATKPALDESEIHRLWETLRPAKRGLVVAGRLANRKQGEAVLRLAGALGWPLLPDVGSQVRLGSEGIVAHYDAILAGDSFAGSHAPEAVVHVGGRALSKRLEQFLLSSRPDPYVVVRENPFRLDPAHRVTHSVEANILDFCAALVQAASEGPSVMDPSWTADWQEASEEVGRHLDGIFSGEQNEPLVARVVLRNVPPDHALVVANSMPVRDLDTYAAADGAAVPVAANRGASGIDGTVATAAGFARGLGRPVTLLIGDLALLHDLNSLAMLRDAHVIVVVLNNDGGGIFSFFPIAGHKEFFEPYFGTPQGVGFEAAAKMFGLDYELPGTTEEFVEAYGSACARASSTLIEIETDRGENAALHRRLLQEVADRVEKA